MVTKRPPAPIAREVRQRCAFGCVMCGKPVYDYEHIEGYDATGDDPAHITLLCADHHREKTAGRLPVDLVRQANASPYNVGRHLSSEHSLYFSGDEFFIGFGNMRIMMLDGVSCGLVVDGALVFGAEITDGRLRLTANLRDINNRTLVRIDDGHLRIGTSAWDATVEGPTITLRDGHGSIAAQLELHPPTHIEVTTAKFFFNGVRVEAGRAAKSGGLDFPYPQVGLADLAVSGAISVGCHRPEFNSLFLIPDSPRAYGAPPASLDSPFRRSRHGGVP